MGNKQVNVFKELGTILVYCVSSITVITKIGFPKHIGKIWLDGMFKLDDVVIH